jgi:two-component system, sensor histidine kinase
MRSRASSFALVLAVVITFGIAAWAGIELTRELGRVAAIWFSNAILVSALLLSDRRQWPALLVATWLTNITVNWLVGDSIIASIGLSFANTIEATLAATLLRNQLRSTADLLDPRVLLRFFSYAVLLAPAVAGAIASTVLATTRGDPFLDSLTQWWAADALGMAIVVPLAFAMRPIELRESMRAKTALETLGPFALLLAIALFVFSQNAYPILFLLLPPLLLIAFRMGFAGASVAISLCAGIAIAFTIAGYGPFMLVTGANAAARIMVLQLLLATLILTTYPVCAVIAGQAKLLRELAGNEERFRGLAANSSDIIALTDMDGIWRYMSPAVETLFGWKPDELIGKDGIEFVHIEDAQLYRRGTQALQGGLTVLTGSFRMRRADGQHVWVETISRALFDANGKQTGWVSNSRDISARKRVEEIKNEFISTVSHELRTPLTAMLAAVGLAASGKFGQVDTGLQRLLDMAKSNGDRLATLVNDILDFEKVSSGKMQFDLQPYDLDELLNEAVTAIRPYANELRVGVQPRWRSQHAKIRVDARRFQQVMANLLSNAAKFSRSGGVIELDAQLTDDRCRISVIDHGCGIPPDFRASLFDRFSQADASDERQRGGTGLGMAIAKHLTQRMSGTISFESEENIGTTFYLEFPIFREPHNA